jgi:hypothetical protein
MVACECVVVTAGSDFLADNMHAVCVGAAAHSTPLGATDRGKPPSRGCVHLDSESSRAVGVAKCSLRCMLPGPSRWGGWVDGCVCLSWQVRLPAVLYCVVHVYSPHIQRP